jgi:3-hydroxy acid dehydrogenase / malonic semialdehyde reductase
VRNGAAPFFCPPHNRATTGGGLLRGPVTLGYHRLMTMKGKIVFITGASSGIGAATALAFAAEGAKLLLCARRTDKLAEVASAAKTRGAEAVHTFALDVRHQPAVEAAMGALPPEWAAIEVLVNNAGLSRGLEKLYTGKIEDWEEMIDTNVKGLLYITRAVVPGMVERGRGHIVNLGSTAGELAYPNGAVYCGSKAAERLINDGLRQDLLGTPVRVTSVDPGMVETDFSLVRFRGDTERAAKVYKGVTPLTPEDVAEVIVWAAMRPAHVNIARVSMTTIHQANSILFHREG